MQTVSDEKQITIEENIRSIVKEEIDKAALTKNDAEKIIEAIMPHIDVMIAKQVKYHMGELGKFLTKQSRNKGGE